ncbi:hypothetical protein RCS94_06470 [Orbaceae bacterium ac157xtp]
MATVLVGNKYPQHIELNVIINDELKKFIIEGAKNDAPMGEFGAINNSLYGATTFTQVDEDLYNAWYKENSDSALVKNGIIFTAKDGKSAKSIKAERAKEKTGVEGLKVETDENGDGVCKDARAKRA